MRQRSRRHTLLHNYELDARSSVRLEARSDSHELAHVRMRQQDVRALGSPETMSRPIIALFSTRDPRTPVSLRSDERLYVRLPEQEAADEEADEEEDNSARAPAAPALQNSARGSKEDSGDKHDTQDNNNTKAQKRRSKPRSAPWSALRLLAHHSCITGMRVSGIVHRAIVRLQPDTA